MMRLYCTGILRYQYLPVLVIVTGTKRYECMIVLLEVKFLIFRHFLILDGLVTATDAENTFIQGQLGSRYGLLI